MTVYLVGAGPGDPGLLTLRGRELLERADSVLYDGLVDRSVLDFAHPAAELIDVGKTERGGPGGTPAAGGHGSARGPARQSEINALLVRRGRRGACVVRLKGGDPFVYGRGGEEADALARAGVPFEIVPGVSSAIAAPAYAGIPVTHRGVAASVAFLTGHAAPERGAGAEAADWARAATAADTLVVLMGVSRLPDIVAALVAAGRDPETPAAAVERGTTPEQRTVVSGLARLPAAAAAVGLRSPAVIVVGEVVRLRERLAWFETPASAARPWWGSVDAGTAAAPPACGTRCGPGHPTAVSEAVDSSEAEVRACA